MSVTTDTRPVAAPIRLERSAAFTRAGEPGDGLTLEGYAAVFDQRTTIDSWEGSFVETIRRGAFRKSIRERTPVMQFDHGRHALIGSIPIGRITDLREDEQGLFVAGQLSDNWLIEPLRDAIRDEAVDGMSFRFEVVRDEWRDKDGKLIKPSELAELLWNPGERGPIERTLIEVRVAELGPVVFPAYAGTSVSVRAADVCRTLTTDDDLRRDVRRALAADETPPGVPADEELRSEVARAVLFGLRAAPLTDDEKLTRLAAGQVTITTTANGLFIPAAPPTGHPARTTEPPAPADDPEDAPPAEGHPSLTESQRREIYMREAYLTRNRVGKKR